MDIFTVDPPQLITAQVIGQRVAPQSKGIADFDKVRLSNPKDPGRNHSEVMKTEGCSERPSAVSESPYGVTRHSEQGTKNPQADKSCSLA